MSKNSELGWKADVNAFPSLAKIDNCSYEGFSGLDLLFRPFICGECGAEILDGIHRIFLFIVMSMVMVSMFMIIVLLFVLLASMSYVGSVC